MRHSARRQHRWPPEVNPAAAPRFDPLADQLPSNSANNATTPKISRPLAVVVSIYAQ
jgi:hypothetical protein